MAILISPLEIENNLGVMMLNHMILNYHNSGNTDFRQLLANAYDSRDMQTIINKLKQDVEFVRLVRLPDKVSLKKWLTDHINMIDRGHLKINQIQERYARSVRYINQVLDFRNPPLGQRSTIDALIHGGFHQMPKLC